MSTHSEVTVTFCPADEAVGEPLYHVGAEFSRAELAAGLAFRVWPAGMRLTLAAAEDAIRARPELHEVTVDAGLTSATGPTLRTWSPLRLNGEPCKTPKLKTERLA